MKVTVANSKGGVGKTTTAVFLATVVADAARHVQLWDADPQGSLTAWGEAAQEQGAELPETVTVNLRTVQRPVPSTVDLVVIDTNPYTPDLVQAAMDSSDLILVPTTASPLDLERTWLTLEVANQTGATVAVLLTVAEPHTLAYRQAVAALRENGAPLLESFIPKATAIKAESVRRPREYFGYAAVAEELGLI